MSNTTSTNPFYSLFEHKGTPKSAFSFSGAEKSRIKAFFSSDTAHRVPDVA